MSQTSALLGTWKMVSWLRESVTTGEKVDRLGPNPIGYLSYSADGRMFAIAVKQDRPPPVSTMATNDEKLGLFDSMLAYAGTYTIDADSKPKSMTITGTEGPNHGKTFPAIYELKGDTLRICYDLSGAKRPTEFKSVAGTKLYLVTYSRKKE